MASTASLVERIPSIVKGVRSAFDRGVTRGVAWRKAQLRQVKQFAPTMR
jgi:hypothetical protein